MNRAHKAATLARILDMEDPVATLVFCRTRMEVDALVETFNAHGHRSEALHGGMLQRQRDHVMGLFRSQKADLLIATDVAARGLDITHISHVVNYDVPASPEVYLHRIGRTGRAGREGTAITLAEPREHRLLKVIESFTQGADRGRHRADRRRPSCAATGSDPRVAARAPAGARFRRRPRGRRDAGAGIRHRGHRGSRGRRWRTPPPATAPEAATARSRRRRFRQLERELSASQGPRERQVREARPKARAPRRWPVGKARRRLKPTAGRSALPRRRPAGRHPARAISSARSPAKRAWSRGRSAPSRSATGPR